MILAAKAPSSSTLEIPQVQNVCLLHFSRNPEAIFDGVSWLAEIIWLTFIEPNLSICPARDNLWSGSNSCACSSVCSGHAGVVRSRGVRNHYIINGGLVRGPFQSDENSHRNVWVRQMGFGMSMWHCSLILSLFIFFKLKTAQKLDWNMARTSNVIDIGNESPYDDPIRGSFCRKSWPGTSFGACLRH